MNKRSIQQGHAYSSGSFTHSVLLDNEKRPFWFAAPLPLLMGIKKPAVRSIHNLTVYEFCFSLFTLLEFYFKIKRSIYKAEEEGSNLSPDGGVGTFPIKELDT